MEDADLERVDLLEALAERSPRDAFGYVDLSWRAERLDLVARICRGVLKDQPGHVPAADHLIRCLLAQGEHSRAQRLLERASRSEPVFQLLRAELFLANDEIDEAAALVRQVSARAEGKMQEGIFEGSDGYWRNIFERSERLRTSMLHAIEGREAVLRDAARSGKLLPNSGVNHTLVGQAAMASSPRIASRLTLAHPTQAAAHALGVLAEQPTDRLARVRLAEAALRTGKLAEAEAGFRSLVHEDASYFPGQLGLGAVLLQRQTHSVALVRALPEVALDPRWLQVIVDWEVLLPDERKVVACSAAPLAKALPGLLASGSTIRLLPIEVRPVDLPETGHLEGHVSDDGRNLNGIGGFALRAGTAVARIEGLCAIGHGWVFAHELAHLAFFALPEVEQQAFEALFEQGRQMEWAWMEYQRSNVDEFFAVTYEQRLLRTHGGQAAGPEGSELLALVHLFLDDLSA
jgi:hypothetical protein